MAEAQITKSHQWENRVLLIMTNSLDNDTFIDQIKELKSDKNGLEERKLIIYQIEKNSYKIGLNLEGSKAKSNKLYNKYKKANSPFEIVLIGLDGSIKLRQAELLTIEKLFGTIDTMPMRRSEIRNKRTQK